MFYKKIYIYNIDHIQKIYREVAGHGIRGRVEPIGTKAVDTSSCENRAGSCL
jgi:hypothetical protein